MKTLNTIVATVLCAASMMASAAPSLNFDHYTYADTTQAAVVQISTDVLSHKKDLKKPVKNQSCANETAKTTELRGWNTCNF